jgi:hypothetical protein
MDWGGRATVGTIGTTHYDDEECAAFIADTTAVVDALVAVVQIHGAVYLEQWLDVVRHLVAERVDAAVTPAPGVARSRTLDGGPPH